MKPILIPVKQSYLALAQGYMLYGYAFAELPAEDARDTDYDAYLMQRNRARDFYCRAFGYARRGLVCRRGAPEVDAPVRAHADVQAFDQLLDVPFLYWCGASLGKWIALSKTDPAVVIRLPEAAIYMQQAATLDPDYDGGAIHEFFISYESRGNASGDSRARVRKHYERALELASGRKLSPRMAWLEAVVIPDQDLTTFDRLVAQVLAFDPAQYPECALVWMCLLPSWILAGQRPVTIKLATLAPEGTIFYEQLLKLGQEWARVSDGAVRLKIYAGGIAGSAAQAPGRPIQLATSSPAAVDADGSVW